MLAVVILAIVLPFLSPPIMAVFGFLAVFILIPAVIAPRGRRLEVASWAISLHPYSFCSTCTGAG
jgi:hypothetical protein